MELLIPKIMVLAVIASLWVIGGHKQAWARDLIVPFILGTVIGLNQLCGVVWKDAILAVLISGAAQIIRLGYGNYSPHDDPKPSLLALITRDRNGWWIRAIWGAVVGVTTVTPILCMAGFNKYIFLATLYIAQLVVVCFTVVRLRSNVLITDILIGLSFGSAILFF